MPFAKYHYLRSINQMAMNRICELFGIKYPVWQAEWSGAVAGDLRRQLSNAGGLGLIGAGSMHPGNVARTYTEMQGGYR